jgi:ketosteroid isomerase-like protein
MWRWVPLTNRMPRKTVDHFYRAWLGRDLEALAEVLDEDVRWS